MPLIEKTIGGPAEPLAPSGGSTGWASLLVQRPELSMTPRRRKVEHIGPWFRRRHWSALNLALLIAVSVWLVGFLLPGDRAALAVIFALPTALMAVTFGTKGGIGAGLVAIVLLATWGLAGGGAALSGWPAGTAMLILGAVLGEAVDGLGVEEQRERQADAARRSLVLSAERRREAVEVNDRLVQNAAAAKWALEAGDTMRALEILEETIEGGQRLVTALINDDQKVEQIANTAGGA